MRNRLGLLVVGVAIAGLGVAACSSTTSTSTGAAQDDVAVSASGRPGSTAAPALSCADGGACAIGDTGPGNGIVFYVATSPFTSAAPCGSSCTTLEAQTSNSSPGSSFTYCTGPGQTSSIPNATSPSVGGGFQNTLSITASNECSSGAGFAASAPSGGLNDWYLPSTQELSLLVQAQIQNSLPTGLVGTYWTSSATQNAVNAYVVSPGSANSSGVPNLTTYFAKSNPLDVRAIRAF